MKQNRAALKVHNYDGYNNTNESIISDTCFCMEGGCGLIKDYRSSGV